jgi:hypothetical protein
VQVYWYDFQPSSLCIFTFGRCDVIFWQWHSCLLLPSARLQCQIAYWSIFPR